LVTRFVVERTAALTLLAALRVARPALAADAFFPCTLAMR
jgi:hypothetical protein